MEASRRKIIVLTPVKNEAWILERFLKVSSIFADHIIIADQHSSDGSLEIYKKYSKVILIANKSNSFNEAERQHLLISEARRRFGTGNILLAIDADEILAADAMDSADWQKMLKAEPGTILFFEKPTFYKSTSTSIRYLFGGWPLGYVDDGAPHSPSVIHSTRVPTPSYAKELCLDQIKFLHYALVRLDAQVSKQRMYSMLENIQGTKPIRERRRAYPANPDFSNEGDRHETTPSAWFRAWEQRGIDMHSIPHEEFYWYDFEALKLFKKYGVEKFYPDDIWNFNWENCRKEALNRGIEEVPDFVITPPNFVKRSYMRLVYSLINMVAIQVRYLKSMAARFFSL